MKKILYHNMYLKYTKSTLFTLLDTLTIILIGLLLRT